MLENERYEDKRGMKENSRSHRSDHPVHSRSRSPRRSNSSLNMDEQSGGYIPRTRSVSPRPDRHSRENRETEELRNQGNVVFVTNLSQRVRTRDLEDEMSRFGKIKSCNIVCDPHTKESRGFAFVTFEDVVAADSAISEMNGSEFHGRAVTVERSKRARPRTPTPGRYYGHPRRRPDDRGDRFPQRNMDRYERGDRGERDYRYEPRYEPRFDRGPRDYPRGGMYDRPPSYYRERPYERYERPVYPEKPIYERGGYSDRDMRDRRRVHDPREPPYYRPRSPYP